jgi:hypothetical protein
VVRSCLAKHLHNARKQSLGASAHAMDLVDSYNASMRSPIRRDSEVEHSTSRATH